MRRHRYPHGRSTGGIRIHNGIRIRIRKVKAVPVHAEFIRTVFSPCNLRSLLIDQSRHACEIVGLIERPNGLSKRASMGEFHIC